MDNKIGKNIKKYRISAGLTQERLSQYLNVSHQAVSKWESGETYPDLSILPQLASIFHITIDTLFSYKATEENNKIDILLQQIEKAGKEHNLLLAETICHNGTNSFPSSYILMTKLAVILKTRYLVEKDKNKELLNEAIRLCEIVLGECLDANICLTAKRTLAISYSYLGDTERALEITGTIQTDYDNIRVYLLSGEAKIDECKKDIKIYSNLIKRRLKIISKVYKNLEQSNLSEKYLKLSIDFNEPTIE